MRDLVKGIIMLNKTTESLKTFARRNKRILIVGGIALLVISQQKKELEALTKALDEEMNRSMTIVISRTTK